MTDTNMEKKTYTTEMISGAEALFSRLREAAKHDGTASFPFLQAVQFEIDEMRKAARPAPQMGEDWVDPEGEFLTAISNYRHASLYDLTKWKDRCLSLFGRALSTRGGVDVCTWTQDPDPDIGDRWHTECGGDFLLANDDTPSGNDFAHCCYCGKKLAEAALQSEQGEG